VNVAKRPSYLYYLTTRFFIQTSNCE